MLLAAHTDWLEAVFAPADRRAGARAGRPGGWHTERATLITRPTRDRRNTGLGGQLSRSGGGEPPCTGPDPLTLPHCRRQHTPAGFDASPAASRSSYPTPTIPRCCTCCSRRQIRPAGGGRPLSNNALQQAAGPSQAGAGVGLSRADLALSCVRYTALAGGRGGGGRQPGPAIQTRSS